MEIDKNVSYPDTFKARKVTVGVTNVLVTGSGIRLKRGIQLLASEDNSDVIYIGNSDVNTTDHGFPLAAGKAIFLEFSDTGTLFAISDSAAQSLYYILF